MGSISWGPAANTPISSGVQAGEVLAAARTHLNDDEGLLWPDQKLFPKLREAHRALQLVLVQNGVPVINEVSTTFLVPTPMTDITAAAGYPTNILMPIWMKERGAFDPLQVFSDMIEVDFLPSIKPGPVLGYWTWNKQKITTVGATQDRYILLRYRGGIKIPQEVTDTIGPYFGELYLSYKTAALAVGSVTPRDTDRIGYLEGQATMNLENVLANAAIQAQSLPTKRRPYHRGRSRVLRSI